MKYPEWHKGRHNQGRHYIKYGKSQAVIDGQSDITIGGDTNYT